MVAPKLAIRYVKGHVNIALNYEVKNPDGMELIGYSDADWAGCPTTRRSTSGGCILLNGCLLTSWSHSCVQFGGE